MRTDKLKLFISHRDSKKVEAKNLAKQLEPYGITCFVAHDTIEPMSLWKDEILKALQTMEAFVCFITADFYESEWTNQELGYAIAKGAPVYLYSHDKSDPKGFKLDIQAIKTGIRTLIDLIRRDFSSHIALRQSSIDRVTEAKDGSFDNAKNQFVEVVGLFLTDPEIETLVEAIKAPARYINQLQILLSDPLKGDHVDQFKKQGVTHYRDLLKSILDRHSRKRFEIKQQSEGQWYVFDNANEIAKNLAS